MSDPDCIDVIADTLWHASQCRGPWSQDDCRAALRAFAEHCRQPPAATKLWVEQRLASALAGLRAPANPSEPPKSSPSEWAQARERLRDVLRKVDPRDEEFDSLWIDVHEASSALLALGDPAPADGTALLRELRATLGRRRVLAEQAAEATAWAAYEAADATARETYGEACRAICLAALDAQEAAK